ncbi:hypothetical protein [Roseofilum casamattae]|uniref:Uncharacterized protein n=1 Tax=Roseofilum casamattae BLCC-M143 TaxID=3022442 RepID=A0ABT7BU09_9CYAN|nr:hypothetical protein [Roseofilum casamattae]MDJ1182670.1 hypothetical protein [Roseofilum casamattae BLCC-M143]
MPADEPMERVDRIDILQPGRPMMSPAERKDAAERRQQNEREWGYQLLVELCAIGESDAARQLSQQHPEWGYEISNGWVRQGLVEPEDWG